MVGGSETFARVAEPEALARHMGLSDVELAVVLAIVFAIVFAIAFAPLGDWVIEHWRYLGLRFLIWRRLRGQRVRVSCGALLRISEGGYLLVRMLHRQEAFGPFGGAYKYREAAKPELETLTFEPQALDKPTDHDLANDLRGYLTGGSLPAFLEWFEGNPGRHRESDSECLRRELGEELAEIGVPTLVSSVNKLEFRFVRAVQEGPDLLPGEEGWQLRILHVYEFNLDHLATRQFRDALVSLAAGHDHLVVANEREIRRGRAAGKLIGSPTAYLLGQRRIRPDGPPFDL
jgi:hypothetical protein